MVNYQAITPSRKTVAKEIVCQSTPIGEVDNLEIFFRFFKFFLNFEIETEINF